MAMRILGISEGSHDAAWCLIEDGNIIEAHHAERHSKVKNEKWLNPDLLPKADIVVGHEIKSNVHARRKTAGQSPLKENIRVDAEVNHHDAHAWAGYSTSSFDYCNILVVDAIGENQATVLYDVQNGIWEKTIIHEYPQSLGLAYSAVTASLGFKPMEEEYIVMGLSAYGEPTIDFSYLLETNCHKGIGPIQGKREDIAASIQYWYEQELIKLVKTYCNHNQLILMGGCALNCVANTKVRNLNQIKDMWIMPNPGDAGSALGAAAKIYDKKINWKSPYLGTNIKKEVNPREIAEYINKNIICGIANGKAEFGPRALGNRSLLANPMLHHTKTLVNNIKKRQQFRPFAPAILEEYVEEYFDGPVNEYMQFTARALHPYESVTHVDGTARVQVVKKDCDSILRKILEEWYELTKCPMLLNSSLNIKGQPMVNTIEDAYHFENMYNVKVF
jgi:carbamoyltransferase